MSYDDDDELLRIGKDVLAYYKFPINEECWIRSGITDIELRTETKKICQNVADMRLAIQAIVISHYLDELILEGIIAKSEKKDMFLLWSKEAS